MISVCIATFNGGTYIREQIESILIQLHPDDEVIVSDDHSTDNTLELIQSINDPRIFVFMNKRKKGLIGNFENALEKAKGDYIFLSDQDDKWEKNKVEIMVSYLRDYELVMSDCKVVNEQGKTIYPSFFQINNSQQGLILNLFKNSYIGCCMAFRRDILLVILPFPSHIPMHDIWIGFVCELLFRVKWITEPLVAYRRHSGNASISASKSHYSIVKKLIFRFNTIRYIFVALYRAAKK